VQSDIVQSEKISTALDAGYCWVFPIPISQYFMGTLSTNSTETDALRQVLIPQNSASS